MCIVVGEGNRVFKIGKSRTAEHFKPCFYQTYEELGRCTINGAPWSDAVSHEPSQCLIVIALAVVFVEQFGSCKHESLSAIANHTISYDFPKYDSFLRSPGGIGEGVHPFDDWNLVSDESFFKFLVKERAVEISRGFGGNRF